jgi:hypothetical protein
MKALTGIMELDLIILQNLNDYELGKVCQVNKYVNSLCDDDIFWLNRNMIFFKLSRTETNKMMKYLGFNTYKELYKYLSTFPVEKRFLDQTITIDRNKIIKYFKNEKIIDSLIEDNLDDVFPEWIDRNKLIFELRRRMPNIFLNRELAGNRNFGLEINHALTEMNRINNKYNPFYPKNYDNFQL